MTPLRVAQASFHADAERRGGDALLAAWPTLTEVALASARAGVEVFVVQAAHADEVIARDDVSFHFVEDDSKSRWRVCAAVAALEPDVIHVQGFGHPLAMRQLLDGGARVPVLVQDHGGQLPSPLRMATWRWGHKGVGGVAFTSSAQAETWQRAGIVARDVPVFQVLESSTWFTPGDVDEARKATGMSGDPCFLWAGHLDANKDPLTLLDAFELALAGTPNARLYCCFGSKPLEADVHRRLAGSPTLAAQVSLLGAIPHTEMERRFRAADFFVQMSHREGSGYSVIEALACGATPLVTDIPSLRAIVGDAGSLTPVGDAPAMARAMLDYSARNRHAFRRAARQRFDDALTFAHVGSQLVAAYSRIAGVSGPARVLTA